MKNFIKALASVLVVCAIAFALSKGLSPHEPWGYSSSQSGPVVTVILQRLPSTIELVVSSAALGLIGGAAFVLLSRSGRRSPEASSGLAMTLESVPFFWLALLLQLAALFSRKIPYDGFSSSDRFELGDHLSHLALPAVTLAFFILPIVLRGLRLHDLWRRLAIALPEVIGAAALTELIFARPGLGRLIIISANMEDGPLLAGCLLVVALVTIVLRPLGSIMPAHSNRERSAQ